MKKLLTILLLTFTLIPFAKLHAASVSFITSGGGAVYTGSTVNVTVSVSSPDTYNAVSVNVNYSNLIFLGATAIGGWTAVSGPSNSGSSISYSGALLGSSASGTRGVLSISFRMPNSPGSATINSSGNIALADGMGTLVSGGGNTVTYNIVTPPPPPDPVPNVPTVTSSTQPDPAAWYSNTPFTFSWNKEDKVDGFSYSVDTSPDTVPDDTSEGTDTSKTFDDFPEGVNYFHIKARNNMGWGPAAHFQVNIDRTAPDPFGIATLENDTEEYILYFYTNDSGSGVDHYILEVDGVDLGVQGSKYEVPITTRTVKVTAVDKAGNSRSQELMINEEKEDEKPAPQPIQQGFDIRTALITFILSLILFLIIIGGYLVYKRYKKSKVSVPIKTPTDK